MQDITRFSVSKAALFVIVAVMCAAAVSTAQDAPQPGCSATINGMKWNADSLVTAVALAEGGVQLTFVSKDAVKIVIHCTQASGTMRFEPGQPTYATMCTWDEPPYHSIEGEVTLTEPSEGTISGTFFFRAAKYKQPDIVMELQNGMFSNIPLK